MGVPTYLPPYDDQRFPAYAGWVRGRAGRVLGQAGRVPGLADRVLGPAGRVLVLPGQVFRHGARFYEQRHEAFALKPWVGQKCQISDWLHWTCRAKCMEPRLAGERRGFGGT